MFSRQDAGPRGSANGIGTEGIFKEEAFPGKAVNMGRLIDAGAVSANCLAGVIVREDKDNVGA